MKNPQFRWKIPRCSSSMPAAVSGYTRRWLGHREVGEYQWYFSTIFSGDALSPKLFPSYLETSRVADSSSCVSSLTLGLLYFLLMLLDIRTPYIVWLVVSTPLKNISQLGLLFPIYGKIKSGSKPPTSLMSKRHNVLQQIISKRWNTHKSNQMLTHNNNNDNNNNICTSKQIANSFFWYVFSQQKGAHKKGRVGCLRIA